MDEKPKPKKPSLSKDDLEHLRTAREIEAMMATPGWKLYIGIVEAHIEGKMQELLAPSLSFESMLSNQAAKGAVLMGKLCRDIAPGILRVAKELRESHAEGSETD